MIKLAAALVALGVAGVLIYRQSVTREPPPPDVWYYDLNTGKIFVHRMETPPIAAPSGPIKGRPAGVRAYVFACGQCSDESARFAAWLETRDDAPKPAPEAQESESVPTGDSESNLRMPGQDRSILIKRPEDESWVPMDDFEADYIQAVKDCPDGSPAIQCVQP